MDKNRLYASLEAKLTKNVGHRADMQFADARKINKSTAHFMLAYTEETPTTEDIADFFIRQYNAKITPYLSTARVYNDIKVITVVASLLNVTREFDDHKKMTPVITGAVYLDVPLQETWEVKSSGDKKVLVRKVKDDVMAIVQARKNAMMDSHTRKTFAALAEGSSMIKFIGVVEKGDHVKAFCDGKICDAVVVSVSEGEVTVKLAAGNKKLPRQAVIEVISRAKEQAEKAAEVEYFTDAYGDPSYAKKLVK